MLELRRRVQTDPASIAFAQLAEECRRAGSNEEAVEICRAGLARNPGYLSAHVTLGRALIELGQLDAAKAELDVVVAGAPDNLAAIRGLAEILQLRGQMTEALQYYKHALELAKHDRDLEDTVERISQVVAPAPPPPQAGPQVSIEEIFNFDRLIDQLGLGPLTLEAAPAAPEVAPTAPVAVDSPVLEFSASAAEGGSGETSSASAAEGGFGVTSPKLVEEQSTSEGGPQLAIETAASEGGSEEPTTLVPTSMIDDVLSISASEPVVEDFFAEIASASAAEGGFGETSPPLGEEAPASEVGSTPLESIELALDDADSLAVMERELRELEERRVQDEQRARRALTERRRDAMIGALETWLSAIVADRERHSA